MPLTNNVTPVISGSVYNLNVLSCTTGTWSGNTGTINYSYQWKKVGVNIPGATSSTYTVALADEGEIISCRVTAVDDNDTIIANSNELHHWVPSDDEEWSTLVGWYDAQDTSYQTLSGSGLTRWLDKGPNGNDLPNTFGGLPQSGTRNTDGKNVIDFISVNNCRVGGDMGLLPPQLTTNCFMQADSFNDGDLYHLYPKGTNASRGIRPYRCRSGSGPTFVYFTNASGGSASFVSLDGSISTSPLVLSQTIESGNLNSYSNGALLKTSSPSIATMDSLEVLLFGDDQTLGNPFNGYIGEFLLWEGLRTLEQVQLVEGYIAHRWGRTSQLDAGHPYKSSPPEAPTPPTPTEIFNLNLGSGTITDLRLGNKYVLEVYLNETLVYLRLPPTSMSLNSGGELELNSGGSLSLNS